MAWYAWSSETMMTMLGLLGLPTGSSCEKTEMLEKMNTANIKEDLLFILH
jgi:hypothetical protein